MSAEELRSFVREALDQLDDKPRTQLVDDRVCGER